MLANPLVFDLKSDRRCGKITESQRGMFHHNNTSRLNDLFVGRWRKGGAVWCNVTFHESNFSDADFKVLNADFYVHCCACGFADLLEK